MNKRASQQICNIQWNSFAFSTSMTLDRHEGKFILPFHKKTENWEDSFRNLLFRPIINQVFLERSERLIIENRSQGWDEKWFCPFLDESRDFKNALSYATVEAVIFCILKYCSGVFKKLPVAEILLSWLESNW